MEKEIWKPVPSLDGVQASSWGRVLLPQRTSKMPNGSLRVYKTTPRYGTVLRASRTARHVYMGIYNKFFGNLKVHRLVCEAFHGPAPEGKPIVIHSDEDATNNRPENLRWGTQKENLNMPKFIAYCKGRTGEKSPVVIGKKRRES
jgi:hypothetical protein